MPAIADAAGISTCEVDSSFRCCVDSPLSCEPRCSESVPCCEHAALLLELLAFVAATAEVEVDGALSCAYGCSVPRTLA